MVPIPHQTKKAKFPHCLKWPNRTHYLAIPLCSYRNKIKTVIKTDSITYHAWLNNSVKHHIICIMLAIWFGSNLLTDVHGSRTKMDCNRTVELVWSNRFCFKVCFKWDSLNGGKARLMGFEDERRYKEVGGRDGF